MEEARQMAVDAAADAKRAEAMAIQHAELAKEQAAKATQAQAELEEKLRNCK